MASVRSATSALQVRPASPSGGRADPAARRRERLTGGVWQGLRSDASPRPKPQFCWCESGRFDQAACGARRHPVPSSASKRLDRSGWPAAAPPTSSVAAVSIRTAARSACERLSACAMASANARPAALQWARQAVALAASPLADPPAPGLPAESSRMPRSEAAPRLLGAACLSSCGLRGGRSRSDRTDSTREGNDPTDDASESRRASRPLTLDSRPRWRDTRPVGAPSASGALGGAEPSDAIRVVNAMLTQLDSLKTYPNALVCCTSNITGLEDGVY